MRWFCVVLALSISFPTKEVTEGKGFSKWKLPLTVHCEPPFRKVVDFLKEELEKRSGEGIVSSTSSEGRAFLLLQRQRELSPEEYRLEVGKRKILLEAGGVRGALYGVLTFLELVKDDAGFLVLPRVRIRDWPSLRIRGFHLCLQYQGVDFPFFKKLIRQMVFSRLNTLVVEVDRGMKYDRHPEISAPWALPKDKVRELVEYARSFSIEVIPEVQSLGHQEVLLLPSHPELAEDPSRLSDYCPSNPLVYRLLFDVMEEVIGVFRPRFLHIGHDEVKVVGVCPRCRSKKPFELFAQDVRKIRSFLAERGIVTMMWADMLDPYYHGKGFETHRASDLIDKDVVLCYWNYSLHSDYPGLKFLTERGFTVVGTVWYDPENVKEMARAVLRARGAGLLGTSWYPPSPSDDPKVQRVWEAIRLVGRYGWDPNVD